MEPEAIGDLLERHGPALVLYARQLCEAPEDVVQEAFLRLDGLGRTPDDPAAWLFRTTRNLAIDASLAAGRRRKHEARAARAASWFEPGVRAGLDGPDAAEVEEALRHVPQDQREVIVAHLWGGLTFEQIATTSGTSSSTAHRLYARGLELLRERMGVRCPRRKKD